MPWYFYSGKIVRPIPVKRGVSVAVQPSSTVEILEETPVFRALYAKRLLRRTAKPKDFKSSSDIPVQTTRIEDVLPKSEMAKRIAEKGRTSSPNEPPTAKTGIELTEGEAAIVEKKTVEGAYDSNAEVLPEKKDSKEGNKRRR